LTSLFVEMPFAIIKRMLTEKPRVRDAFPRDSHIIPGFPATEMGSIDPIELAEVLCYQ
jgi:hypothetical protein